MPSAASAAPPRRTRVPLPTAAEVAAFKLRYERLQGLRGAELDAAVEEIRAEHLAQVGGVS